MELIRESELKRPQDIPQKGQSFFKQLRKEVMKTLNSENIPSKQPRRLISKAVLLWGLWAFSYGLFLFFGAKSTIAAILLSVPWAVVMLLIQMAVMHDASHSATSDTNWINNLLTGSIAFLGGSSLLWVKQHCVAHHNNTNIFELDHDIDTNGLLRFHPSQPLLSYHKYQHIYAWLLYPLFILNWVWWGDFRDLVRDTYKLNPQEMRDATIETFAVKVWHTLVFILLPYYFLQSWWLTAVCYLISFVILGFFMVVIFQLAHISNIQALPKSRGDVIEDWAVRQLATTANFATNNTFLTWAIGGLNYQIEHHIFPAMSHVNYPRVSKIVESMCQKHKINYLSYPTIWSAVVAHQKHLVRMGQ